MAPVLLVIHVFIAIALVGVILMQRSSGDGFGTGSSGGNSMMSGRATANLLTRTTAVLAALFMINSLVLATIASHSARVEKSIVDNVIMEKAPEKPLTPRAVTPSNGVSAEVAKPKLDQMKAPAKDINKPSTLPTKVPVPE